MPKSKPNPESFYIYEDTVEFIDLIVEQYDVFQNLMQLMQKGNDTISMSKKILNKHIDETWVTAIEESLLYVDTVIRNPGKSIEEVDEVLPMELSRNITPRSLQHLSQHTDYISKVEGDMITPSKILNVYKEETMSTYENKFVNTLIDRLYIFVHRRYDTLKQYGKDESAASLSFENKINDSGTDLKISFSMEAKDTEDKVPEEENTDSLWDRIEKIRQIVDEYKRSPFCAAMGKQYVRPPIMRSNAIMKNPNLKQCLVLWQFIEGYDKVGYEIEITQSQERPHKEHMNQLYAMLAIQYLIFRYHTVGGIDAEVALRMRKTKSAIAPKIKRGYDSDLVEDFDFYEAQERKIVAVFPGASRKRLTAEQQQIRKAIDFALADEKKLKVQKEKELKEKQKTV